MKREWKLRVLLIALLGLFVCGTFSYAMAVEVGRCERCGSTNGCYEDYRTQHQFVCGSCGYGNKMVPHTLDCECHVWVTEANGVYCDGCGKKRTDARTTPSPLPTTSINTTVCIHSTTELVLGERMPFDPYDWIQECHEICSNCGQEVDFYYLGGSNENIPEPTATPALAPTGRKLIAAGEYYTFGIKPNGTVIRAGKNDPYYVGQADPDVSEWTDIVAVYAGHFYAMGLKQDGTVLATGMEKLDNGLWRLLEWKDIVALSIMDSHCLGLKSDGTVVALGRNSYGAMDVYGWRDVVAVAAGNAHSVGLRTDGTAMAVGWNAYGQCDVSNWTDIVAIAAGGAHTVGLKSDGTVVAIGHNGDGQCNVSEWKDIVSIAAGTGHTVGLKSDGSVVAVGSNYHGQCNVYDWAEIISIDVGKLHTVGLKTDGTVVAVGWNATDQCNVEGWNLLN